MLTTTPQAHAFMKKNILSTEIFSDVWKQTNVVPVHKKEDPFLFCQSVPIYLKKVLFKHLYNYIQPSNLITKKQSGFRQGDLAANQLIDLVNQIQQSFDSKGTLEVRAVFLDISKAFDKVWHDGLLFKLKQNGIDGILLSLLTSYLTNRK